MVSPPWEPHPERRLRLEKRAKRPKNKNKLQNGDQAAERGRRKKHPATDSSFSSSSSTDDHARGDGSIAGYETDSVASSLDSHGSLRGGDGHARVRPEDCWCLRVGGCGDEDGCCAEDLPGVVLCPCFSRISPAVVLEVRSFSTGQCESISYRTECYRALVAFLFRRVRAQWWCVDNLSPQGAS